jgi:hypothetical protein
MLGERGTKDSPFCDERSPTRVIVESFIVPKRKRNERFLEEMNILCVSTLRESEEKEKGNTKSVE